MPSDFVIDEKRPWLGGYKDGPRGDEATYFSALWIWLVNDLKINSVVDIGCGSGIATDFFETLLPNAVLGIDGIAQSQENIIEHDYTTGPFIIQKEYDLAWCCECLEHIEEKFLPNILSTFKCAKTLLITHAFPGQSGHHHVLCQTPNYWIGVFAAIGYRLDADLTLKTRELASLNTSPWNHYRRSGMAFVRN